MPVKLVVFDIAGTTVKDDGYISKAFRQALHSFGYNVSHYDVNPLMGYEKTAAIRSMLLMCMPDVSMVTDKLIVAIHRKFVQLMIDHYEFTEQLSVLPNVEKTFSELKRMGIHIALNTGFSRDITDTILDRLNWMDDGLVDFVICSDEVELGRPHPDMINLMMEHFRITDPMEIAKVGDTEVDIREGQSAGCRYVIGVTTGAFLRSELEKYSPTHIIDDMSELLPIIS